MIYLECKFCEWKLSEFLTEGIAQPEQSERDMVLPGQYIVRSKQVYVNVDQSVFLKGHRSSDRSIGCCGPGPDGLPNLVCGNCGAALARKVTDCIFPRFIRFEESAVNIVEIPKEFQQELFKLEQESFATSNKLNGLLAIMKYNPEEFKEQFQSRKSWNVTGIGKAWSKRQ